MYLFNNPYVYIIYLSIYSYILSIYLSIYTYIHTYIHTYLVVAKVHDVCDDTVEEFIVVTYNHHCRVFQCLHT